MSSQFQQPAISNPEDKFVASEHNGALLLFFPNQFQQKIATQHGESDAVATRIVNLDSGRVIDNALIFATALVTQLKAAVPDGMVLGRLGQGQNTKGNPPWLLSPHTDQDVAKAEYWLAANPRNQFAQPQAQAAPAPAAPAWGGAPAAPTAPANAFNPGGSYGVPAAPAWGGAPAAPAAPAWGAAPVVEPDPTTYDEYVAAFKRKGVDPSVVTSAEHAAQLWAMVKNNPNVA